MFLVKDKPRKLLYKRVQETLGNYFLPLLNSAKNGSKPVLLYHCLGAVGKHFGVMCSFFYVFFEIMNCAIKVIENGCFCAIVKETAVFFLHFAIIFDFSCFE